MFFTDLFSHFVAMEYCYQTIGLSINKIVQLNNIHETHIIQSFTFKPCYLGPVPLSTTQFYEAYYHDMNAPVHGPPSVNVPMNVSTNNEYMDQHEWTSAWIT